MLTLIAATAVACNALSIDAPRAYPAANPIVRAYAADFNGDGRLDVGTSTAEEFTIRYNTGGGSLGEPVTLQTSGMVVGVANLLGDALPDLVDSPHRVRENRGGREFPVAATSNEIKSAPVLADFTNDGRPDLLTANSPFRYKLLSIDGTTVRTISEHSFGEEYNRDLQAGDFNGDGNLDVFIQHQRLSDYKIFHGNGQGQFSLAAVRKPKPEISDVVVADVDRDGRADIIGGAYDDGVPRGIHIVYGNTATEDLEVPERTPAAPIAPHDLDGDGDLDLGVQFFFDQGAETQIFRNINGAFVPVGESFSAGSPLRFADFTGDGHADLLTSVVFGVADIPGNGDGTFRIPRKLDLPLAFEPFAVDLDGNGLDELIFYSAARVTVARPNGNGAFTLETLPFANGIAIAAANNEIAVGNTQTGSVQLFSRGADGWQLARTFEGPPMDDIALGDFTGDGRNELAIVANVSDARSLRVRETGSGRVLLDQPLPPEQYQYDLLAFRGRLILTLSGTAIVFNGDPPSIDLQKNGSVIVYSFDAAGTATQQVALANDAFTGTVAGDFNGDGRMDVLSSTSLAYGRANGTFAPPEPVADPRSYYRVAADLNGDGATDLVTRGLATFTWWRGAAAGLLRASGEWLASGGAAPVVARLRLDQPASILFGRPELVEVTTQCVAQGKRRGVRH